MKLFIPTETPFILCTIYHELGSYHYVYKNIDSSNNVDSGDCPVVVCASLRECTLISQRSAQASQQFNSNRPLGRGLTISTFALNLRYLCVPMYLLCLFSDSHIFNYHNYGHPASLAFSYFGCPTTVCTVYLFIYSYILVNYFSCLQ